MLDPYSNCAREEKKKLFKNILKIKLRARGSVQPDKIQPGPDTTVNCTQVLSSDVSMSIHGGHDRLSSNITC